MLPESSRKNRTIRVFVWLSLSIIVSTLITLFELAKTNGDFSYWHSLGLVISCAACAYILAMTYYVKVQRVRARKANDEKYRSIITLSDIGAWEYHPETGYMWCSPEYYKMLGYDEVNFLKHHRMNIDTLWINLLHPDDRDAAIDKFKAFSSCETSLPYENTFRLKHRMGNWIWVLSRSKTLCHADGTRSKIMLGSHIDITEKIATQVELRRRNQKLVQFAFSNAHHVRGPVARMLGLLQLAKIDKDIDQTWYVETICSEIQKLDENIRSISLELDEIQEHDRLIK